MEKAQEIYNELLILLVENKLKPAAIISLSPHSARFSHGGMKYAGSWCDAKTVEDFIAYLGGLQLSYNCNRHHAIFATRSTDDVEGGEVEFLKKKLEDEIFLFEDFAAKHPEIDEFIYVESFEFIFGYERELKRLVNAQDVVQTGLALGYPDDAVFEFEKQGIKARKNYEARLQLIKDSGIQLPSWMAYLDHIPVVGLSGNEVCSSSRQLAERYQYFVRAENPSLAERIEALFQECANLPVNNKSSERLQAPLYILKSASEVYCFKM